MKLTSDPSALGAALRAIADRVQAAGYTQQNLRERLGVRFPDDIGLLNRAPTLERLRPARDATARALRLFYLEADEPSAGIGALLAPRLLRAAVAIGLLARRGDHLRARMRLDVHAELRLFADRRLRAPDLRALGLPRGDMVYPPGSDSAMLAEAVPVRDGERVLDLCTGSGIQALSLAPRAAGVVAVDIGRRAAALAGLNSQVNGAANVEVRVGDLYAPVHGERFDLILANPPFVPAPTRGPAYHSGGPKGDRVLKRVMAGLGAHLRPGGRAVAISHLALRRGETVAGAVAPWVRGFDGRVLALVLETGTPVDLAAAQALFALQRGFDAYGREVRRWVQYLSGHRIGEIVLLILAAERTGRAQLDVLEAFQRVLPLPLSQPPPVHVEKWFGG
ncbi:MAG: methyltransferase [Candidatus Binatia bacterium]